jgi:ribosomal protein L15
MEVRFSNCGGCGNAGGGTHEHGEWEAVSGGQTKVFRLVGVKGLGIEKGRKLEFVGCGT